MNEPRQMDHEMTIRQLGGKQIFAMAFRHALTEKNAIVLFVARGLKTMWRADRVRIELNDDDTYSVESARYDRRKLEYRRLDGRTMVYADDLRATVESLLGVRLTLGTMQAVAS